MKQVILIVILFYFINMNAQKGQRDTEKENLKNKVKSYTQHGYKALLDLGKIKKGKKQYRNTANYRTVFNKNGDVLEREFYSSDSTSSRIIKNKYNNDVLIEAYSYYSRKLVKKTSYKYDQKKNIIETKIYKPTEELLFRYIYQYDNARNKTESHWYDQEGNLLEHENYTYNKKGALVENKKYNDEYLKQKFIYQYKNGRKYETTEFYKEDTSLNKKKVSVYNKNNKIVEKYTYLPEDVLTSIRIYSYNENNDIIKVKIHTSDGMIGFDTEESRQQIEFETIYTYKYQYDEKGNWIKVIQYENKMPKKIIERHFEYYESKSRRDKN